MHKCPVPDSLPKQSYRESHIGKGSDYHQSFSTMRHRAMIWRLEQKALEDIGRRYMAGREIHYLDFACGTGRLLGFMQSRVRMATGIDVARSMLEVARTRVPTARILEGDLTRDALLTDETFDLITAFRFFPNAEAELRADALAALRRRLRPNGYLLFNNHLNREALVNRIVRILGRGGMRGMTDSEVRAMVAQANLRVVETFPLGVIPMTDRHMLGPVKVIEVLERALMSAPGAVRLAQNVIYVCNKL